MAEEESKLINAIFSVLAVNGKLTLYEIFSRSSAVRILSGGRHELNAFLWNHTHLFHFHDTQQKYGNQDRERYAPFAHLFFTHLRDCNNCTIGCLLNFLDECEEGDQGDIAAQRQYYCGYDCDGLLQFLQDHEGLYLLNERKRLTRDKAIRLNPTALNYESVRFSRFNPIHILPSSSAICDNSCIASGTAAITAVYPIQRSVTMQFVSIHLAGDYIYSPISLLSFEAKEGIIVEVQAVRMYNVANEWRATSVKRATNHRDSNSSPETKCAALFQLLRTTNTCKTAEVLINEIQPRNVFTSASKLSTFVKNNPHIFRTRADMICVRSIEHTEAFIQVVNALGRGSFSISLLGDTLDDECDLFWKAAYGLDSRRRVLNFYYDHAELFEVLIEFPNPLHNEIKLIGMPFMPTQAQLEEMKAAQSINISPAPLTISLTEERLSTSDCESNSYEEESETVTMEGFSCINDVPVGFVYQPNSRRRSEAGSVLGRSKSKSQSSDANEPHQTIVTKQTVITFAALSEIEKCVVELIDNCLLAEGSAEISKLYEKLKSNKLRPFTNVCIFKEFLAKRRHLYILDDYNYVSCLDPVRRSRVNLLLRLAQTQCSISDLFEQLGEENRSALEQKDNLLNILLKYKNLFEITEEYEGERYVKARGGYNTSNEIFLPYIYRDIRIKSEFVQQKHQAKKTRRPKYTQLELQKLIEKARQFIMNKKDSLAKSTENFLSRCKPSAYYKEIEENQNCVEQPYIKDRNGHERSPINGRIKGLFLNVGKVDRSPFGDVCYRFKRNELFRQSDFELFFADFYCPPKLPYIYNTPIHKVTLVVSKKHTDNWTYCNNHLVRLNWERNDFFILLEKGRCEVVTGKYGDVLWVEILYLEALYLKKGKRRIVATIGNGQSHPLGLPANEQCQVCSI